MVAPTPVPAARRARPLAWLLLLGAALGFAGQLVFLLRPQAAAFVGLSRSLQQLPARPAHTILRAEEAEGEGAADGKELEEEEESNDPYFPKLEGRGLDLDGDKLDNLEEWYQEAITGPRAKGGEPHGFIRDLILRSYTGYFNKKNFHIFERNYTGGWGVPLQEDYDRAFELMKTTAKEGNIYLGKDDLRGWLWLVAEQRPDGISLYYMKSPPYGERPLALIKQGKEDEFFDNVDWQRLYIRLHKWNLWGGRATKFPYPVAEGYVDGLKQKPPR